MAEEKKQSAEEKNKEDKEEKKLVEEKTIEEKEIVEEKQKEVVAPKEFVLPKGKKSQVFGNAKFTDARISLKSSKIICKELRGKRLSKSKMLLNDLLDEKKNLNGKYYTKTVKKILEILTNAEANAVAKGLDDERLFIYSINADKGRTFIRPRSKMSRRGERAKMTHIEIIVGEK